MGRTRRAFLIGSGGALGAIALGLAACSSGDDDEGAGDDGSDGDGEGNGGRRDGPIAVADVPAQAAIYGWIREVVDHGIRRPGYEADRWAEQWVADRFRELGLEDVRLEPVPVTRWEPVDWSLEVVAGGDTRTLECFPLPYSAPVAGLELELAAYDEARPEAVAGKASLVDVGLLRIPADMLATAGSAPADVTGRVIDPEGTLAGAEHVVPFGSAFQEVMEPSIDAGAAAFIGALTDYPGGSYRYFVPYDGVERPLPGVWISGRDGAWLRDRLAAGPVRVRLTVDSRSEEVESYNVVGDLPGPDGDREIVMIGSHHDGPWASAVEDASGIALVLAQATYWAARPAEERPHRLRFLLQGGHMCGGAGLHAYIDAHRDELDDVVLEVHLEHAARELAEEDGELRPTGQPVPRWFFTSRLAPLEEAVGRALEAERLHRSMVLAPDAFGEQPPTDGGFYHQEGVPIVNFLTAPFYLFDEIDTLDKVDRDALVPLTRATIRIVDWTRGVTAAELRAADS
ncbi:MAG TPA: M28 family peptidase [Acidimicrobiales bacterium]